MLIVIDIFGLNSRS